MVGKTTPITRQDEIRFKVIQEYCGCLCCLIETQNPGYEDIAHTTIEHVTDRGRRLADPHQATIGLCPWHHQAVPWNGLTKKEMGLILGPSLAQGRKLFEERYGDEVEVLLPLQDQVIIWFAEDPWPEYTIPAKVRQRIRAKWTEMKNAP
jgi:hypothetical protein